MVDYIEYIYNYSATDEDLVDGGTASYTVDESVGTNIEKSYGFFSRTLTGGATAAPANLVWNKIVIDTELGFISPDWEYNDFSGNQSGRLTYKGGGPKLFKCDAICSGVWSGVINPLLFGVMKNGATPSVWFRQVFSNPSGGGGGFNVSSIIEMNYNDYLEMGFYVNGASTFSVYTCALVVNEI